MSTSHRPAARPASRNCTPAAGSSPDRRMRFSSAFGCTRHFASGLRRHVPTPVHGASIITRSILPSRSSSDAFSFGWRSCTLRMPARSMRGISAESLPPIDIVAENLPLVLHHRGHGDRLAAAARAIVQHLLARRRTAHGRRDLAAHVLHFDPAFGISRDRLDRLAALDANPPPESGSRCAAPASAAP